MAIADSSEGIYNDCTNVVIYKTVSSGVNQKVGVYCWADSGDSYTDISPAPGHGELEWAMTTGLSIETIHRLWLSISHFVKESDNDSKIVLLDADSLAARNQLLMVTAASVPECLTVTVFSKASGNLKVWSESTAPGGSGFCETFGIEPEVRVSNGKILVKTPVRMHSEHAYDADVVEYTYVWTGSTYNFRHQKLSLQFVSPSERP